MLSGGPCENRTRAPCMQNRNTATMLTAPELINLVGNGGIEPPTFPLSEERSTTELVAHIYISSNIEYIAKLIYLQE